MKNYLISFGDSDKYIVPFDGSREEFVHSEKFREIEDRVFDYLKQQFPTGGYRDVLGVDVEEARDGDSYPVLDRAGFDKLLNSVKRQVEVWRQDNEMNNNAPYDQL